MVAAGPEAKVRMVPLFVKVAPFPIFMTRAPADCSVTGESICKLLDANAFIDVALIIRVVDAAGPTASSVVVDAAPSDTVPEVTTIASVAPLVLLPPTIKGLVIDRLPVVTVWITPSASTSDVVGLNSTALLVPVPALAEKLPVPVRV